MFDRSHLTNINCTFIGNEAEYLGGAIRTVKIEQLTHYGNLFIGNTASTGSAIYVETQLTHMFIEGDRFYGNTGTAGTINAVGPVHLTLKVSRP